MGILGNILGTVIDIATLPLDAIQDVGEIVSTGRVLPNIREKVKDIAQDSAEIVKSAIDLEL